MRQALGNDLILGNLPGSDRSLGLSRTERDKHLHVVGSSGAGKTKFLENLIRQDIVDWRRSKCGILVIDPHGNLYDNLINWLAWSGFERPIVPIDLRQSDWVVSYNVLRQREKAAASVLVENFVQAMAYVWGQGGTNETPLFAQWAWNIFSALYEKKLTLIEAKHLVDREAKRIRQAMTTDLKDDASRQDWQFANSLNAKDFDSQIGSTVRRLRRFITNPTMLSMFGLPKVSLDLGNALEEGSIILVNLATEGAKISQQDADLFATLLLSDLWTAAKERGKREPVKPFYVYVDEFQQFVTPTIAENLDQARGFGLNLTLAHQFPLQLSDRGENGKRVFHSIMENAQSKVVFRLSYEENLRIMAQWLFMGLMNPDEIKLKLYSRKVMDYRRELAEGYGFSTSSGRSVGTQHGRASGAGAGGTNAFDESGAGSGTSESWSTFASDSESQSESWSESETTSRTFTEMLVPIFGEELSHVQYRSLEEQTFRAMAVLFDQKERQSVARTRVMNAPVSIYTPEVRKRPGNEERTKRFLEKCYKKLPFALSKAAAQKQIDERAETFAETLLNETADEPTTARRRIR
jgi:hypothetical protein